MWLITTCLGMLLNILVQKYAKRKKIIIMLCIVILLAIVNFFLDNIPNLQTENDFFNSILNFKLRLIENENYQIIALIIIICIICLVNDEKRKYYFKGYSKKIQKFTRKCTEQSTISIIAGDMDFFGKFELLDNKVSCTINNSDEYKQLLALKNTVKKIRIICNTKLEESLKSSILNKTISCNQFFLKEQKLDSLHVQQLLRIGKIFNDFDSQVEFRFYNTKDEDTGLRGRFISEVNGPQKGIIYEKEGDSQSIIDTFITFFKNKILKQSYNIEKYYIKYINDDEIKTYMDLYEMKWNNCDIDESCQILEFCSDFYNYVEGNDTQRKMALVYVDSYEIARKKHRKEFPPFGVLYLAAVVKNENWKVKLFSVDENNYKFPELADYDVVGFSIVSSYSYSILKKCNSNNSYKKGVIKIAGGYIAEKFYHSVFKDFDLDIIFKGEGENKIQEFVSNFENLNYGNIAGIYYYNKSKNIIKDNVDNNRCVNLDRIPFPARELLDDDKIVMNNRLSDMDIPMVHIIFSRGCEYNCLYCAANQDNKNSKIRYRSKEKIVEELQMLKETYNIKGFSVIDDCFLTKENKAMDICEYIIKSKVNLKWSLAARIDHIDDEILSVLKEAGVVEIKYGIETGSDTILKKMCKGYDINKAREVIKKTYEKGISVKVFIITGLPGESAQTHSETKNFLIEMKQYINRVSLLRFTPLAGSYIYDNPEQFGINQNMLKIENFDNMRLYRESSNWWIEKERFNLCQEWYNDMKKLIDDNWGDK